MSTEVVAILCSDLHISGTAPVGRAAEPNWFAAQDRGLGRIRQLQEEHDAPVVIAGNIFDRWYAGPETINFAMRALLNGYAVPGQHDLPNHNYSEIVRSAYWTLAEAGRIVHLGQYRALAGPRLTLYGFPWGFELKPLPVEDRRPGIHVAVVHRYIYTRQTGCHFGADPESMVDPDDPENPLAVALDGYDAAVFGDHHRGFHEIIKTPSGRCSVFNAGTLTRRHRDERDYEPWVGLLFDDGTIVPEYIDQSTDLWKEAHQETEITTPEDFDAAGFLSSLQSLGADSLDFRAALFRKLDEEQASPAIREFVTKALEG